MKNKNSTTILFLACLSASCGAHAAILNTGDRLTLKSGVTINDVNGNPIDIASGSWFALNLNGNLGIEGIEKTALAQGTDGIVIGQTTPPGSHHNGSPLPGDTNAVTAPWVYFGATGSDYLTIPVTGGTQGVDMRGWHVAWHSISALPLGSGAWDAGFTDGIGNFSWDGLYGSSYTLDYRATIPANDPNGFGGLQYGLHLEGRVERASIPEPATLALIGSGLLGMQLRLRRKTRRHS